MLCNTMSIDKLKIQYKIACNISDLTFVMQKLLRIAESLEYLISKINDFLWGCWREFRAMVFFSNRLQSPDSH